MPIRDLAEYATVEELELTEYISLWAGFPEPSLMEITGRRGLYIEIGINL